MLSPTDIHYLVGLLTRNTEASDLDVELGSTVYDKKGKGNRDIDITVTRTEENGQISIFKSLEVKRHKRPLTVEQVEQLCVKLADAAKSSQKFIVSASGYTEMAVNKVRAHKVKLLEVVDWQNPEEGFNIKFLKNEAFSIREVHWEGSPQVRLDIPQDYSSLLPAEEFPAEIEPLYDEKGNEYSYAEDVKNLANNAAQRAINEIVKLIGDSNPAKFNDIPIKISVKEKAYIKIKDQLIPIKSAIVKGRFREIILADQIFKVLRFHGEVIPIAGCVLIEKTNQDLIGVSVNNLSNKVFALSIPFKDRLKKKVRRQKIS